MTATKNAADSPDVQVYNLDHTKTPGRMKVRWRVRTATGKEAERLEKQQNQVIIKLLIWADEYLTQHEDDTPPGQETTKNIPVMPAEIVTSMSPERSRTDAGKHGRQERKHAA